MLRIVILSLAATAVSAAPLKINIGTLPGLQYDMPRFAVEPGQKVVLTFKNTDEMEHNLAIVAPGKRLDIVLASASLTPDSQYIPKNDDVLWHTPVLKPDETAELKFTAPKAFIHTYAPSPDTAWSCTGQCTWELKCPTWPRIKIYRPWPEPRAPTKSCTPGHIAGP